MQETQGLTPLQLQTSEEEAFDVSAIVKVTITHVVMPEFRSKVDGKDGYLDKPLLFGGLRDRPIGVPTDRGEVLNLDGEERQVVSWPLAGVFFVDPYTEESATDAMIFMKPLNSNTLALMREANETAV